MASLKRRSWSTSRSLEWTPGVGQCKGKLVLTCLSMSWYSSATVAAVVRLCDDGARNSVGGRLPLQQRRRQQRQRARDCLSRNDAEWQVDHDWQPARRRWAGPAVVAAEDSGEADPAAGPIDPEADSAVADGAGRAAADAGRRQWPAVVVDSSTRFSTGLLLNTTGYRFHYAFSVTKNRWILISISSIDADRMIKTPYTSKYRI